MNTIQILGLGVGLAIWSIVAQGKTIYVEKWGNDSFPGGCGSKSLPCQSIGQALNQSGNNDRIVVGPGIYVDSTVIVNPGIKLESTGGRFSTVIESTGLAPALRVTSSAPKVRIGKVGKGFTFRGADNTSVFPNNAGLTVDLDADNIKVEGNQFTENRNGITLLADKAMIRRNILRDNVSDGLMCSGCDKSVISENRFDDNARGIGASSADNISILRNHIVDSGYPIQLSSTVRFAKVMDNVSENNGSGGIAADNFDGLLMSGNINAILDTSIDNGPGFDVEQVGSNPVDNDKAARIQHNLAVGNSQRGFRLDDLVDTNVTNNHAVQNDLDGIGLIASSATVSADLNKNATWANQNNCGLYNNTGITQFYRNHFFGNGNGVCGNAWTGDGKTPARPAAIRINRARKL